MIIYYLKCKRHAPSTTSFTRVTLLEWIRCTSRVEHIPLVWGIIFKVWTNVYLHFHLSNRKKIHVYGHSFTNIKSPWPRKVLYKRGRCPFYNSFFYICGKIIIYFLLYHSRFVIADDFYFFCKIKCYVWFKLN